MTVELVVVDGDDSAGVPESPDVSFIRTRFTYGLAPETITRELVRRGRKPHDAQRSVEAIRRDRYRRV